MSKYGAPIKSGTSDSVLSSLFRTILLDLGISAMRFDQMLERYMIKAMISSSKEVASERGNIKKELLKPQMSWRVFIKGLVFLQIKRFDISVTLHHVNGHISTHTKAVNIDTYADTPPEDTDVK